MSSASSGRLRITRAGAEPLIIPERILLPMSHRVAVHPVGTRRFHAWIDPAARERVR